MLKKSRGKLAIEAGIGYTVGNILIKGISFISIPIFARLLTISDYGIYNTFSAYVSIMGIIVGLALNTSLKNANIDYHKSFKEYTSSLTIIVLLNTVLWVVGVLILLKAFPDLIDLSPAYLVILVIIESMAMSMITYYNNVLAVDYRFKEYLGVSLAYSITGIGISIVLCLTLFNEERYLGRIYGTLTSALLLAVYILTRLYRAARPRINKIYWKYALKISIPIVPHGLSQVVLAQFDRLMINKINGSISAGLYSFAYNIGAIFQIITNSLDTSWTQWFFDKMSENRTGEIRKVSSIYAGIVSYSVIILMLISPELITILGGGKYDESKYVALPIILAMFYSYLYNFPASIEYYKKKTVYIGIGTMIAAILNVVLNLVFIPRYGYVAAAYTTVFCFLVYYILHTIIARFVIKCRVYNLPLQILLLIIVSGSMFICLLVIELMVLRYIILLGFTGIGAIIIYKNRATLIKSINEFRK